MRGSTSSRGRQVPERVETAREDALRDGRTMLGVLYYELFGRGE